MKHKEPEGLWNDDAVGEWMERVASFIYSSSLLNEIGSDSLYLLVIFVYLNISGDAESCQH